jgi:FixJ family two-component response regulator
LSRTPLVAVVDDDEMSREATGELIETFGLATRVFASGAAFLASDCVQRASCLLADVQMPDINGLQLLRKLTSSGHRIPVIFFTAFPDERIRKRALKAGAICYLSKPVDPTGLLDCIRSAIGPWQGEPAA